MSFSLADLAANLTSLPTLASPIRIALTVSLITLTTYLFKTHRRASRLTSIQALNARDFPSYPSNDLPVAVFLGGTAGIGRGMAESFARLTKGNAHIILIGRNATTAQTIIDSFPKPTVPGAKHEFIRCDATLMSESQRTIDQLLERLPKIDYLVGESGRLVITAIPHHNLQGPPPYHVLTANPLSKFSYAESGEYMSNHVTVHMSHLEFILSFGTCSRKFDSPKGIVGIGKDARFKFVRELTPLLLKATPTTTKEGGGKVYIVGGAGLGKKIDYGDLGFKTKGYGFWKIRAQFPVYLDVILQEFAARNPSMTFIHAYPGPVRSALADNLRSPLFLFIFRIVFEFSFPFTFSESGDYMMHAMLTTARRPGAWSIDMFGEKMSEGKVVVATEDERKMLWEHSLEETRVK
ncbi:hypothetical protein EV368DRAFT_61677 [Lentinula lateritia]|nr:hypothetical protein EV368DRAFT_61677 [Lentinula lateritia]